MDEFCESMMICAAPVWTRLLPMLCTLTSHSIMTMVSLSGAKSSTSMSVVVWGKRIFSRNEIFEPTRISVVFSELPVFIKVIVTLSGRVTTPWKQDDEKLSKSFS